jgi:hypothetical protein
MAFEFGSGLLYGIRNDISNGTPQRFGTMQDVTFDFSGDMKELFGQYQYPVAIARGKSKIEGKAKFATVSGTLFNNIYFGVSNPTAAGSLVWAFQEAASIPATTPFTYTVSNAATFDTDLGVLHTSTGLPFTKVASAPTTGQYAVSSTGVYTFASADTGIAILIDYTYASATVGTTVAAGNPLMGNTPTFEAVFCQTFQNKILTVKLFSCVAGKLSYGTKIDDFAIPEIDFQGFANSAGNTISITVSDQ